ncbi:hypothetical protein [Nocardia brasiliensis]|uniref:hypothetical protein n=1 Tax=Nocardia brasiliensis TaxID=37326 RepID=UPI00245554BE|nr:hypothetical protein [Nocardia brasiliensis]
MSGGFYNHYDDPDEYWDDEPLRPTPKSRPAASSPQQPVSPSFLAPPPPSDADSENRTPTSPAHTNGPNSNDRSARASGMPDLEGLLAELAQFHGYTTAISNLMQEAFAAGPSEATAHDKTGAVQVTVTRTGELRRISVAEQWDRYVSPTTLGPAFVDAVKNAEMKQLELTSVAAAENGTIDRLEALDVADAIPTKFKAPEPSHGPDASLEQLLEETLPKLNNDPRETVSGKFVGSVGTEQDLQASVTLTRSGIFDCTVQIPWGINVSGSQVAWVIKESYDQAYGMRVASGESAYGTTAGTLITQAVQVIANLQSHPPTN